MKLRDIDLNLLVACDLLLSEVSVTRAASRLHVSQPAMSHSLAKLRDLFDDPLLVREGGRVVTTPLAQRLLPPLQQALAELQTVIERRASFDPSRAERSFVVATTDYISTVLLPRLVAWMATEAPQVRLEVRQIDTPRYQLALERGEVDLAISVLPAADGVVRVELFKDEFASLVRRNHPLLREPTPASLCRFGHVVMSPHFGGPGVLDLALHKLGLTRTVAIRIPAFAHGPPMLLDTDLVMTLPRRLAEHYAATYRLEVIATPVALPAMAITAAWSRRQEGDEAHRWFRSIVQKWAVVASVPSVDGSAQLSGRRVRKQRRTVATDPEPRRNPK